MSDNVLFKKVRDMIDRTFEYVFGKGGERQNTPNSNNYPDLAPYAPECENGNTCKFCYRCVTDNSDSKYNTLALCERHRAKERYWLDIVEMPAYGSLDEAAMAAANIILEHVSVEDKIEYGIGIYGDQNDTVFCLVETRLGSKVEVGVDNEIRHSNYSFKAHVHSHPIYNSHEFSVADYILSCGGKLMGTSSELVSFSNLPYPMYLVGSAWLPNLDYEEGEIVTYGNGKLWIAKQRHRSDDPRARPQMKSLYWKHVEIYDSENKYDEGVIVYDATREWPFNIRKDGNWIAYRHNNVRRGRATLTKFTPPAMSTARWLAIFMAAKYGLSPTPAMDWRAFGQAISDMEALKTQYPKLMDINYYAPWATLRSALNEYFKLDPKLSLQSKYIAIRGEIIKGITEIIQKKLKLEIVKDFNGQVERTYIIEDFNNITEVKWKDIQHI